MEGHILLVEDDHTVRQLLTYVLTSAGYLITAVSSGLTALELVERQSFDVVVTDIYMDEVDGIAVLTKARARRFPPEVILLTGCGSFETVLAALRAGAFDYLLKPCGSDELITCVQQALQRRALERRRSAAVRMLVEEFGPLLEDERMGGQAEGGTNGVALEQCLRVGTLQLDTMRHMATFVGQPLHLTPIEFTLLCCLAETPGCVVRCSDIVRRTHGYSAEEPEAQVLLRSHIRNLRRKLPSTYLVTVREAGYMLLEPHQPVVHEES